MVLLTAAPAAPSSRLSLIVPISVLSSMVRFAIVIVLEVKPGKTAATVQPTNSLTGFVFEPSMPRVEVFAAAAISKPPLGSASAVE